jgi:hypothetical protein
LKGRVLFTDDEKRPISCLTLIKSSAEVKSLKSCGVLKDITCCEDLDSVFEENQGTLVTLGGFESRQLLFKYLTFAENTRESHMVRVTNFQTKGDLATTFQINVNSQKSAYIGQHLTRAVPTRQLLLHAEVGQPFVYEFRQKKRALVVLPTGMLETDGCDIFCHSYD